MLKIEEPFHGAVLNRRHGEESDGGISNGGLGLIDNMVVGETEGDLVMSVESADKLPVAWASLKKL